MIAEFAYTMYGARDPFPIPLYIISVWIQIAFQDRIVVCSNVTYLAIVSDLCSW